MFGKKKVDVSHRTYCGKRLSQLELTLDMLCAMHEHKVLMKAESEALEVAIQAMTDLMNTMRTSKKWDYV